MKLLSLPFALAASILLAVSASASAVAPFGSVLTHFTPAHAGNGRAIAVNPHSGLIFYTNAGDNHIFLTDASGANLGSLNPGHNYGALSWDSKRGVLWGGRYDGSGIIDQIDPGTGVATLQFTFSYPVGDSCYAQGPGFTDGLGFDRVEDNLWLSDDNAKHVFHVTLAGAIISSFAMPTGKCNTGIAVTGQFLWLARQSGPDTPPFDVVRVAKSDPSVVISSFAFVSQTGPGPGPEGIAVDRKSFVPNCTVWTNQFGAAQLTAWAVEPGCPANT
ncbi:MAG TPA: hypothetical protein VK131_02745 [Candidatus Acidoferrales bacterium]|nr:hypothetical protein [Candidatus Acidoferrales bacterium]